VPSESDAPQVVAAFAPLCFVVMPFGTKPDGQGATVNFDAVYEQLLEPAIREAGFEPLRADQELVGGLIHKPMFERLILADYAVADLTTANANVFYELGVRHAARPYSTVLVSADVKRTPFDLAPNRVRPYSLDAKGRPADAAGDREAIVTALRAARDADTDSPVFQLIDGLPRPDIDRLKTDVFRDRARYSAEIKQRLAKARGKGKQAGDALRTVEHELGPIEDAEAGVLVDLLLSYRAASHWTDMIRVVEAMADPLRRTVLVREQYGFALNRAKRRDEAEEVLQGVIDDHGASSETLGLLGRVHKDRWEDERGGGSALRAAGHLDKAIEAYRQGFEADWRDAYPGVNAVTLMEIRDPGGASQQEILPVVRYANRRRIDGGAPDYWDHATRLELAVIARDRSDAIAGAQAALAVMRESWEPRTTARNLALIRTSRAERDEVVEWADELETELLRAAEGA
jgi:tetratricopeptide (TPR) repeat protein